jgi:hypothetical protein
VMLRKLLSLKKTLLYGSMMHGPLQSKFINIDSRDSTEQMAEHHDSWRCNVTEV